MFRCSLQLLSSRLSRPSIACRLTRRLRPVSRGTHNGALDDLSDPAFFHARKAEMLRSPPLLAWDVMSPTNSNLLDILLSDFIPSACQPWQAHTRGRPASSRPDLSCRNLPLGHHLVYFPLQKPTSALMKDGTDPFPCPGHPFVQRLWAGGNIDFSRGPDEVRLDCTPAVCIETIEDVRFQQAVGKKGGVVLVDVQRLYMTEASYKASIGPQIESQPDAAFPQAPLDISGTGIRETRTLAFLQQPDADQVARATDAAPGTNSDLPARQREAFRSFELVPTRTMLFQFSALSYNAHMIHLDPAYAQAQEAHRDLLVHGPLALNLMLHLVQSAVQPGHERVRGFAYRNVGPLFVGEKLRVCINKPRPMKGATGMREQSITTWIENSHGRVCAKGTATTQTMYA